MNEKRDFGITLAAAMFLLVSVSYLAQCTPTPRHPVPVAATAVGQRDANDQGAEDKDQPKSIKERATEEQREERAKINDVGHALQTIAANPELRRTLGFKEHD